MIFTLALVVAVVAAIRGVWSPCGLSMLSSLNPVSEASRGHRFWATALWYVAGAAVGGGVLGIGLAAAAFGVGRLNPSGAVLVSAALGAAVVAVLSDSAIVNWTLPVHPRQVDERWLTAYRRWIYAGGFGVQIGVGFATYIMTAAVYLTAALAVLTTSATQAFTVALTFGVVRGLAIGVCAFAGAPDALRTLLGRVDHWSNGSVQLAMAAGVAVAGVAGARLGGPLAGAAAVLALGALIVVPLLGRHRSAGLALGSDHAAVFGFVGGRAAAGQQAEAGE